MPCNEILATHFKSGGVNTGIIRDIQRMSTTTRIIDGKEQNGNPYIAEMSDVKVKLDGGEAKVTESLYDNGNFYSVMM